MRHLPKAPGSTGHGKADIVGYGGDGLIEAAEIIDKMSGEGIHGHRAKPPISALTTISRGSPAAAYGANPLESAQRRSPSSFWEWQEPKVQAVEEHGATAPGLGRQDLHGRASGLDDRHRGRAGLCARRYAGQNRVQGPSGGHRTRWGGGPATSRRSAMADLPDRVPPSNN